MRLTEEELRSVIREVIRKVQGGWKVYPKKPRKGQKRRKALSKKPHKTYKAALAQLRAVERSKALSESIRKIILETTEHDNLLAALPGLSLRYQETLDDANEEITILDLFNKQDLIASATLTKLTGQLQGHPLKVLDDEVTGRPKIVDQRLEYIKSQGDLEDIVGEDEYGVTRYWSDAKCIPNTYSVSSIYTDRIMQNRGVSDLMFDLIFYYCEVVAPLAPAGITTDFKGGNTAVINNVINSKIYAPKNQGLYYKQTTKKGNDEMDFFGLTPDDPDDDCYSELYDEEGVIDSVLYGKSSPGEAAKMSDNPFGTTSSWRKRGIQSMAEVWNMLTSRTSSSKFNDDQIKLRRRVRFSDAYDNSPTPEEIEAYKRSKAERNKLS